MIKKISKLLSIALCTILISSTVACGTLKKFDPDSKLIVVSIFNGGLGVNWFDPIKEEFEKDYPGYTVEVEPLKRTVDEIDQLIALGTQADMYFSCVPDFHQNIYSDELEDLSDVLQMKPDGENGLTVAEKMIDLDTWKTIGAKNGEGIYMLPYEDMILGFNYDHTEFLKKGLLYEAQNSNEVKTALTEQGIEYTESGNKLLFKSSTGRTNYKENDVILRAGKDGLYGTYDDGQPITAAEFDKMVNKLKSVGEKSKAFIFAGGVVDYTTDVFNAIFAQYDGLSAWKTFFTYDGDYTFSKDGNTPTHITMENGYKVFGMDGIYKATEFLQKYLNNDDYVRGESTQTSVSHTDAQSFFVVGGAEQTSTSPFVGMLVEGAWWENEAKGIFKALVDDDMEDYAFGTRDYRIMLYPDLEGQKGVNGDGHGTIFSARSTGSVVIPKQDNRDIVEKTKILLSYTLKDKYLKYFTEVTGGIRPYKYEITDENRANMSLYANNVWDLYKDKENVGLVRPSVERYLTALPYKTGKGNAVNWMCDVGAIPYNMPLTALRRARDTRDVQAAIDAVFSGFESYYAPKWAGYIEELGH